MPILGTKKFWKPAQGASATQKENQILKNAGYINLQLYCVNYMSKGNFWQTAFGGKDTIALATNLKYESGVDSIEATAVQDKRIVKVNQNYNLGLQRNIAVKVPANADAITINVKLTAVKDDLLQAKFDMLNKPEYQSALQLAPVVVGQVITITSLVKKLFSDSDPQTQLEASYGGIVSVMAEDNPVANGKLTKGLLILISTNDGNQFNDVDETKFELRGDTLYYDGSQVENTYLVFNISFEQLKGADEKSNWFKKYNDALNNLDKIITAANQDEVLRIYNDSKTMWIEGNSLLDADGTYINKERISIKTAAYTEINDKFNELKPAQLQGPQTTATEVFHHVSGSTAFNIVKSALPATGSFLNEKFSFDPQKPVNTSMLSKLKQDDERLSSLLNEDTLLYLKNLEKNNAFFSLNATIRD
jgi:hypothetical protein